MHPIAEATGAPIGDFLNLLYKGNEIPQGTHDFNELRELASKSYLTTTYALLEKMVRGIILKYKVNNSKAINTWKRKNSKDENFSLLQELVENLSRATSTTLKNAPEFRLLEYYRLVRVANSHHKGDTRSNAEKAYSKISTADVSHFQSYEFAPAALNAPDKICFADFLHFTRAIKYYSKLLNEACA